MSKHFIKSCATLALLLGISNAAHSNQIEYLNGRPYMPMQLATVENVDTMRQTIRVCFSQSGQCNTFHEADFHGTASACTQATLESILKSTFRPHERKAIKGVGTISTLIGKAYPDSYPVKAAFYDCQKTDLSFWQGILVLDNDASGKLSVSGYVVDNPEEATELPLIDTEHLEDQQEQVSIRP